MGKLGSLPYAPRSPLFIDPEVVGTWFAQVDRKTKTRYDEEGS